MYAHMNIIKKKKKNKISFQWWILFNISIVNNIQLLIAILYQKYNLVYYKSERNKKNEEFDCLLAIRD
jgi:hypothetical protein